MGEAYLEGLDRLRRKMLRTMPKAARDEMLRNNRKNADDFASTYKGALGKGDPRNGHLVDTVEVGQLQANGVRGSALGVAVSVGDAEHPYPLHLEGGHIGPDGNLVAPQPAWNPAKQVVKRRARSRARRSLKKVVDLVKA
jgi:hypothetical protein